MPTTATAIRSTPEPGPATLQDTASIDELLSGAYRNHAAPVLGVAMRSTRDPEVAADLTQEAFLRLLMELQAGRRPEFIGAWLHRTTANLIISRARRESVARRAAPRLLRLAGPSTPDAIVVLMEDRQELQATLSTMSVDEQSALLMAANGASGADIARQLRRSHGSTRTMLCRARERLRLARAHLEATPPATQVRHANDSPRYQALVTTGGSGRSAWQGHDPLPVVVAIGQ